MKSLLVTITVSGGSRVRLLDVSRRRGQAHPQQEKMKKCNADASAKALKGDERKSFMSECLKGEKKI